MISHREAKYCFSLFIECTVKAEEEIIFGNQYTNLKLKRKITIEINYNSNSTNILFYAKTYVGVIKIKKLKLNSFSHQKLADIKIWGVFFLQ